MKIKAKIINASFIWMLVSIMVLALIPFKVFAAEANEEKIRQTAEVMLSQCMQTDAETITIFEEQRVADLDFALLQSGIPCGGRDFIAILNAWQSGIEECGALQESGNYTDIIKSFRFQSRNNEIQLIGELTFANRSADVTFTFENDGTITALTIGGNYAFGEVMGKALLNTVIGMGIVFAVLIFMSLVISCFRFIPMIQEAFKKRKDEKTEKEDDINIIVEDVDDEILCVITAAIRRDLRDYPFRKEEGNMRVYNITVNGKTYEVEVEEAGATLVGDRPIRPAASVVAAVPVSPKAASAPVKVAQPVQEAAPAPAKAAPKAAVVSTASAGAIDVTSGIAGKVFAIDTKVGQAVKAGDTVMVLEAMKMEIPVVSPQDGTIAELKAVVGDAVEVGQVLATLN